MRAWRVRRGRGRADAALEARADVLHGALGRAGLLGRIDHRATGLQVDRAGPVDLDEWLGEQQLAGRAIERVREAVLVEVHQRLDRLAGHRQVRKHHRAGGIEIPVVVRRELVSPHQRAVAGAAREHARGPLVVAGPLFGVVGSGIAGAVVHEIQIRVIGHPAPHRRAAGAPALARPGVRAEIRTAVVGGLEVARRLRACRRPARCCVRSRPRCRS